MVRTNIIGKMCVLFSACMMFIFQFSFFNSLSAQDSVVSVELDKGLRFEMVLVRGGGFTMGNNTTVSYEAGKPEHPVSVSDFYIGRYEVTQAVWTAVMGENPSKFVGNDSLPVEQVSWEDAQQFVTILSQMTGRRFRLPSEAEWEYAARGGSQLPFAGCDRGQLERYSWFCVNSDGHTHPVGRLLPNGLGLYDMSGNVAEWCGDWMGAYSAEKQDNPRGPKKGESRVLRGGHYYSTSPACTVYDRSWYIPSGRYEYYGLRLVMEIDRDEE